MCWQRKLPSIYEMCSTYAFNVVLCALFYSGMKILLSFVKWILIIFLSEWFSVCISKPKFHHRIPELSKGLMVMPLRSLYKSWSWQNQKQTRSLVKWKYNIATKGVRAAGPLQQKPSCAHVFVLLPAVTLGLRYTPSLKSVLTLMLIWSCDKLAQAKNK